ncbi:MAG: alanyl-tRNA editing protein [Acidobacteria bacterium]|nr:alanyl-tRNA editing protein [Acidobacteriota bacterium]
MTDFLYMTDSYMREFNARVVRVDGNSVILDQTAFYPSGGGQPCDLGRLRWEGGEANVVAVKKEGAEAVHTISGGLPPAGVDVQGILDWDRRYALMRTHTALHMLCGVIFRDFGSQVTGSNMEPLKARMDFELETLTPTFCQDIEERVNREIQAARPVTIRILPRAEAFQIPDLIRTKINLLPEGIEEIRVVNIEGLDIQADGGTHVANTQEAGRINVVGHENKGKINKRLRITLS